MTAPEDPLLAAYAREDARRAREQAADAAAVAWMIERLVALSERGGGLVYRPRVYGDARCAAAGERLPAVEAALRAGDREGAVVELRAAAVALEVPLRRAAGGGR